MGYEQAVFFLLCSCVQQQDARKIEFTVVSSFDHEDNFSGKELMVHAPLSMAGDLPVCSHGCHWNLPRDNLSQKPCQPLQPLQPGECLGRSNVEKRCAIE
ncbi:uncharacterized protein [Salvelinus sp. IW2-2015]|uniref:uncharacterized protein isoform X3 n=1 Tax=Salvelinus sp. IW2-2015 TaxID=2691554 RepID=UPI0038D3D963